MRHVILYRVTYVDHECDGIFILNLKSGQIHGSLTPQHIQMWPIMPGIWLYFLMFKYRLSLVREKYHFC